VSSSHHDLIPGTLLGRYEILAPIAVGGMARVWAARLKGSRGFSKLVAIKTMRPDVSDDVRFEQMFLDEAQIASRIRHGNVVTILDLGEQHNLLYLVMEYVDGVALSELRRAGEIPLRFALRIIADTAAGLHAAHRLQSDDGILLGLVHRDVSPQNILVSYDGSVKVTDFGIAKAAGRASATTHGTLKGKPAFMAPEQLEGAEIDARADVFTLGIVAYQLVCGFHPFRGENDLATVKNICSQRPIRSPSAVNREVDKQLEQVILRALERDPARRFQSAAELEHAIDDVMRRARRPRDDELAALMEKLVGEPGRQRRQTLERAMALADQRTLESQALQQPPPSIATSSERTSGVIGTPLAYAAQPSRRGSWRPWTFAALALGVLVLAAVVTTLVLTKKPRGTENAPAAIPIAASTELPRSSTGLPVTAPPAPASGPPRPATARTPVTRRAAPGPSASAAAPKPSSAPRQAPVPVMDPGF
jgi:serine/threonine-protein kinase